MNFLQKHLEHATHTELKAQEKSLMRSQLLRAMKETPVPSPYLSFFSHWSRLASASSATLALTLIVSTTVYAAQGALPGDPLYPIKINVNEKMQGALATSDEEKAQWNARIAEVRIHEAELLVASDRLSTSTALQIETDFDTHTARARSYTKKVSEKNAARADELSVQFSASLEAHGATLEKLGSGQSSTSTIEEKRSKKLSEHVRARAAEIKEDVRKALIEREAKEDILRQTDGAVPAEDPRE